MFNSNTVKHDKNGVKPIIGPSFQLLSNWCSMACAGCGIKVAPPPGMGQIDIDKEHLQNAEKNLSHVRSVLDSNNYKFGLVEQSGGEPTHHPEIVELIGEVFPDCVHKVITNGLPTASIYNYVKRRGDNAVVVLSLDHHTIERNQLRLRAKYAIDPAHALQLHNSVLKNLDLLASGNVPVIVSSTISKWNICSYLEFVGWLERSYPYQISEGTVVPIPVSLVSFGNPAVGSLNPTWDQVAEFEQSIMESNLITVKRCREWLLLQLVGHYKQKMRHFLHGEQLDVIELSPSRYECEIYRHMISFNFQDEEIFRTLEDSLFQGFVCGVKALGNIGFPLLERDCERPTMIQNRPSNLRKEQKYFHLNRIDDYLAMRENIIAGVELIQMGSDTGQFMQLKRGMCLLDDFDGVWWPINMYLKGIVDDTTLGDFCSVFRNTRFQECLKMVRTNSCQPIVSATRRGS